MEKTTTPPRKYSRMVLSTATPYGNIATREAARKRHLRAPTAAILVALGSFNGSAYRFDLRKSTGQAAAEIDKRLYNLQREGYITIIKGTGQRQNLYTLAPQGIKFFNEYKKEFTKIKKHYFG